MGNMAIFKNEMYRGRWSWLIAFVVVTGMLALFAGLTHLITSNTGITDLLASLPKGLLDAFNFDLNAVRTFGGWMASEPYVYYALILGIYAGVWASSTIAGEMDQRTAESMVALPLSRSAFFLAKVQAHWLRLTGLMAGGITATLGVGSLVADDLRAGPVSLLLIGGYAIALAFAGIGYAITGFVDSERTAASLGAGVVVFSFIANVVAGLSAKLQWLKYVSLFNLLDPSAVIARGSLPIVGMAVAVAIFGLGVCTGVFVFRRKDV